MNLTIIICVLTASFAFAEMDFHPNITSVVEFQNRNRVVKLNVTFEAFTPKGLKISVPSAKGLDLFSFKANVNLPIIKRDDGALEWEVINPLPDRLQKDFPNEVLLVGDVINFWIRIQTNGVSLLSQSISHIVKELTPTSFPQATTSYVPPNSMVIHSYEHSTRAPIYNVPRSTTRTTTYKPVSIIHHRPEPSRTETQRVCECNENTLKEVRTQMNYTAAKIKTLEENISPLEEKLNSLTETVVELIKNMEIGTKLLLTGDLPVRTNPVEDVRHLIVEKLKLYDLKTTILQAEYKNNGISFEVTTSIDKLRILKRSSDVLSKLPYQIIDPERPVFDVRIAK